MLRHMKQQRILRICGSLLLLFGLAACDDTQSAGEVSLEVGAETPAGGTAPAGELAGDSGPTAEVEGAGDEGALEAPEPEDCNPGDWQTGFEEGTFTRPCSLPEGGQGLEVCTYKKRDCAGGDGRDTYTNYKESCGPCTTAGADPPEKEPTDPDGGSGGRDG